jgi:D-arabinose 1-dehydrogenase-like Zn-dependent alcohol dehydrogenase
MRPFARQVSFSSVNLLAMMRHKPQDVHQALTKIGQLVTEKSIEPVWPITTYPIAEATQALKRLMTGKNTGKVVLKTGRDEIVPVLPHRQKVKLFPNASYLIIGGVGGIGRSVATWMIAHGAKHLILLSRSAGSGQTTKEFVDQTMQETGCQIKAISCDVANAAELASTLQNYKSKGFPQIRGIVQGAMVLQVCSGVTSYDRSLINQLILSRIRCLNRCPLMATRLQSCQS